MKVKLFAQLADQIGPELELTLPESFNREDILTAVASRYPLTSGLLQTCAVASNQTYIRPDEVLQLRDVTEIALIPPVSGG